MKDIQNTKRKNIRVGRFRSVRPLTTVIFLVFCGNLLNAQDLETSLRQAAKDLVIQFMQLLKRHNQTERLNILKF